jgi:hypothetical protein
MDLIDLPDAARKAVLGELNALDETGLSVGFLLTSLGTKIADPCIDVLIIGSIVVRYCGLGKIPDEFRSERDGHIRVFFAAVQDFSPLCIIISIFFDSGLHSISDFGALNLSESTVMVESTCP